MARAKNILGIEGKLGEISIYRMNGKDIVRRTPGSNKERIQHDPSYSRCRENISEFSGCSIAGKLIRGSIPVIKQLGAGYVSARLNAAIRQVCMQDTGPRGKRAILLSAHGNLLEGFEFNPYHHFSAIIRAPLSCSANNDRNIATVTVNIPDPRLMIDAPKGATHTRLVCAIASCSDMIYNNAHGRYAPLTALPTHWGAAAWSSYIALDGGAASISLQCSVPGHPVLPPGAALIVCAGAEHYQLAGNTYVPLKEKRCLKAVKLF